MRIAAEPANPYAATALSHFRLLHIPLDGLPADFVVCDDTLARQAVYLGGERL